MRLGPLSLTHKAAAFVGDRIQTLIVHLEDGVTGGSATHPTRATPVARTTRATPAARTTRAAIPARTTSIGDVQSLPFP